MHGRAAIFGLDVDFGSTGGELSIASQQLVEIVRGLLRNAQVLILDEPTSSLTRREVANLAAQMRRLKERGIGLLFISHRLNEVLELTDYTQVLRDGRIVLSAPSAELTTDMLVEAMLPADFTAPAGDFDPEDIGSARAQAYDVVWNGQELGGGSIRINRADVQEAVFGALGIDRETAEARFGFLLEALRYGAPPHGGIAYGVDRIVQRLCGAETIRDVLAFPKTASGYDLLTGAPAPVDEMQLRELGVSIHKHKLAGH